MATVNRIFRCNPAEVYAILADGWSYATWVVGTSRIRGVDPQWPAPGSRLAHSVGVWPWLINDETISLRWDPTRGIELQARGWPAGEARVRIDVQDRPGNRSMVTITEDAVRGPGSWIPRPARSAALVPRNTETLRRLAMLAERRSARGAAPSS